MDILFLRHKVPFAIDILSNFLGNFLFFFSAIKRPYYFAWNGAHKLFMNIYVVVSVNGIIIQIS